MMLNAPHFWTFGRRLVLALTALMAGYAYFFLTTVQGKEVNIGSSGYEDRYWLSHHYVVVLVPNDAREPQAYGDISSTL